GDHAVRALKHREDVAGMNRPAERHRPKGEMIEQRPFRRYLNVVRDPRRIWDYLRADFDRDTAEVGDLEPVIDVALRGEGVVQRLQGIDGKSRAFLGRDRQVHRLLDSVPDPGGARLRNQPGGGQQRLEVAERDYTTEGLDGGGRRLPRRVQGLGIGPAFGRQWIANFAQPHGASQQDRELVRLHAALEPQALAVGGDHVALACGQARTGAAVAKLQHGVTGVALPRGEDARRRRLGVEALDLRPGLAVHPDRQGARTADALRAGHV